MNTPQNSYSMRKVATFIIVHNYLAFLFHYVWSLIHTVNLQLSLLLFLWLYSILCMRYTDPVFCRKVFRFKIQRRYEIVESYPLTMCVSVRNGGASLDRCWNGDIGRPCCGRLDSWFGAVALQRLVPNRLTPTPIVGDPDCSCCCCIDPVCRGR